MTREERLIYCKNCENKTFDLKKGIICKLTGDVADFDVDCENFKGNREALIFPVRIQVPEKENIFKTFVNWLKKSKLSATFILIGISYLFFMMMLTTGYSLFNPNIGDIVIYGGNVRSYTIEGQFWRLFTTLFVHVNLWHIITDLIMLFIVGYIVEPVLGKTRFIYSLLITGAISGLVNITLFFDSYNTGLSTALLGLLGVYTILFITKPELRKRGRKLLIACSVYLFVFLYLGLTEGFINLVLIAGFIVGLFVGLSFYLWDNKKEYKHLTAFGHICVIAIICMLSYVYIASSAKQPDAYAKLMNEFTIAEQKALSLYKFPQGTSYSILKDVVKNEGIPNWKICLEKVEEMQKLDELNDYCIKKNEMMKEYCELRIKAFEYLENAFSSKSTMFDKDLLLMNTKIEFQINKIKLFDEIANSEMYEVQGIPNPFLYMVNNHIVSNLRRLDIDKVVDIKIISDKYTVQKITNKEVQGVIKITIDNTKIPEL